MKQPDCLGKLVGELMGEDMGLSEEGFARQLNVSAKTIARWRRGEFSDPFLLLRVWNIAPEHWKLRLLPYIPGEIERWAQTIRRAE